MDALRAHGVHYVSSMFGDSLDAQVSDHRLTILVVESMGIGIVLPQHIARQFAFLRSRADWARERGENDRSINARSGAQIVTIASSWDTRLWDMNMLMGAHTWISSICHKTRREIERMNSSHYAPFVDVHFLDALCFDYKPDEPDEASVT